MSKKLIKGVIYDDVDMDEMKSEMFGQLHFEGNNQITEYFAKEMNKKTNNNVSIEDARLYLNNMDAIAALTRYNEETGVVHNLIIPKECLSVGLVDELEKVDLAKDLLDEYADDIFINYIGAERIKEKENIQIDDFIKSEDEVLLKTIDTSAIYSSFLV